MKRRLRWVAMFGVGLALLLAVLALATLTPVDSRVLRDEPQFSAGLERLGTLPKSSLSVGAPLLAGFHRVKLTPTLGTAQDAPERGEFKALPLAGYGNRQGKPTEGVHDDVWVKAIAFVSQSKTGIVVCADALIIPREVSALAMQQLQARFGLDRASVYFSATHTHCSVGGWGEGPVGEAFAGPFQPAIRIWFAQQLAEAAAGALGNLRPASVGTGSFQAPQFVRNRLVGDRGQIDPEFSLLVVQQKPGPMAILGSYAAHPTILGGGTMVFSAEYPGAWQRAVEKATGGMALFAAGSVGSHSHKAPKGGFEGVEAMGQALAQETLQVLPSIPLKDQIQFDLVGAPLPLPELQARLTKSIRVRPWVASKLLPVGQDTFLQGFRFDRTLWISTPCDFSGELAADLKAKARTDNRRLSITSFNGDYVGYVIPSKYYGMPGYEPRTMSFFGPHLPDYFVAAIESISNALLPPTGSTPASQPQ